ncbi:MAG: hypothetical protein EFT35_09425 [Methanophagales archaeon ANME-1-THS]|nr:MAG: hypothetical protein EFT35_09425 [Methanophagales archaeon ANME-1-THS]
MLKPVEMRELRIVTLDERVDGVIQKIGAMGTVHLADIKELIAEWEGLIEPSEVDSLLVKVSDLLTRIGAIAALLQPPEPKKSIREILFKEREEGARVKVGGISLREIEDEFTVIERVVKQSIGEIERLRDELTKARRLYRELEILDKLGVDLDFIGKRAFISVFVGALPRENEEALKESIESLTGRTNVVTAAAGREDGKFSSLVVVCLRTDTEEVEQALKMADFEVWEIPAGLPAKSRDAMERLEGEITRLEGELSEEAETIGKIRRDGYQRLLVMRELLQLEADKLKVESLLGRSERVRVIEGWAPEEEVDAIVDGLREEAGELCLVDVKEPRRGDVRVPSLLKNPRIIKPFESVVKLYGPPRYDDIDPTILTALIFPVLFGIMFADIGHGLLLLLLGLGLTFAFKGLGDSMREMGVILVLCGLCSLAAGVVFGEFFGFSESASRLVWDSTGMHVPEWLILVKNPLLEPIEQFKLFFVITMLIGALHMGLGLLLNVLKNFSMRNLYEGMTGFVRIWCLFGALYFLLLLFGFHFTELNEGHLDVLLRHVTIFIVLPIILLMVLRMIPEFRHGGEHHQPDGTKEKRSVLDSLIILMEGIIDALLENFFRFLANTISYGRILALALCHAGLMQGFIILAFLCVKENIGAGALVFFVGTALVVVLEALIAGIHTIRLHFYEWFTKFYEGGGVEFRPFRFHRTYTE